jgi:transcriptional regulator with XRE-family HTH domain
LSKGEDLYNELVMLHSEIQEIGQRIKALRLEQGLSTRTLADAAEFGSHLGLHHLEHGRLTFDPNFKAIMRLAKVLGI